MQIEIGGAVNMNIEFKLEVDLVNCFLKTYFLEKEETIIEEMPIRFGNIDVVSIKSISLPFNKQQILVLSKPANALLFTLIKNSRPISKGRLIKRAGLSESTINNVLYELQNVHLIKKQAENYIRNEIFVFPKTTITGYEAKLKDFNKAYFQAKNNKDYVDYSYLVFPDKVAKNILSKKRELLEKNGIGLISVSLFSSKILLKAKKTDNVSNYIRLLNIAKANSFCMTSKGIRE